MAFDPDRIRPQYPALKDGRAWLDGAAGTQVPQSVIDAISDAYRIGIGNTGGVFGASKFSEQIQWQAREAFADLVGGKPEGVFFMQSATVICYAISRMLANTWSAGDEIVVSRLDHDSNVRPWIQAAKEKGVTIRWAEIDLETGDLPADQYKELVNGRTRLVSVTAASNVLGTKPDIATIAEIAHSAGALLYVDGVHSTPHFPIDINAFGADFYVSSSYKWQGPHLSGLAADPELLHRLSPYKLDSSTTESPRKYELGTPPFADLAGLTAAVDHVASADSSATGSRRERVLTSMTAVAEYQNIEAKRMIKSLREMPKVTLYSNLPDKTPTAYFTVAGYSPEQVAMALDKAGVNVWNGHNYAYEVTAALGIRDAGSAVRAGLSLYNNRQDVDRLLEVIEKL